MKSQKAPETSSTNRAYAQGALNLHFLPIITIDSPHAPASNFSVTKARGFCTEACKEVFSLFLYPAEQGELLVGLWSLSLGVVNVSCAG